MKRKGFFEKGHACIQPGGITHECYSNPCDCFCVHQWQSVAKETDEEYWTYVCKNCKTFKYVEWNPNDY